MLGRRGKLKEIENAVKTATGKSDEDFIREYLAKAPDDGPSSWTTTWKHPRTATIYTLSMSQTRTTSEADLEACFSLVQDTSRADYKDSSIGWNPKSKREEMHHPDMRYILVKDPQGRVSGYTSLMPTMEEGEAVVYCYEIHLDPELRGTGISGLLVGFLETVARNLEIMEKVMLTVFTCNVRARAFYRRCGFETDEHSPRLRKLRNGVVKTPDYEIMSKRVSRKESDRDQVGGVSEHCDREGSEGRPAKIAKLETSAVD